jgi:uncharacterized membrane protein
MQEVQVPDADDVDQTFDFARVVTFTDGVFAIAITLLVLGLDVPKVGSDLGPELRNQLPNLFAYALSFFVIGRFWLTHHSFVRGLKEFDKALVSLTLFYLACIVLLPFTSQLIGQFGGHEQAVVVYAVAIVAVLLSFAAQIIHAYRRDLLRPAYRAHARTRAVPGVLTTATGFAISIPVAMVNPSAATFIWLATIFIPNRVGEAIGRAVLRN